MSCSGCVRMLQYRHKNLKISVSRFMVCSAFDICVSPSVSSASVYTHPRTARPHSEQAAHFAFASSGAKASLAALAFSDNVLSTCLLTSAGLGKGFPPLLFLTSSTISSTISSNSTPGSKGTPKVAPAMFSRLSWRCMDGRCPRALSLCWIHRLPGDRVKAPLIETPMMA
jgi:hypothetical protein